MTSDKKMAFSPSFILGLLSDIKVDERNRELFPFRGQSRNDESAAVNNTLGYIMRHKQPGKFSFRIDDNQRQ